MKDSSGNNCCLLQEGNQASDHSHVTRQTPMQTKKKEIMNDPQYQSEAMDKGREKAVTAARRGGNVRPLDGGVAS